MNIMHASPATVPLPFALLGVFGWVAWTYYVKPLNDATEGMLGIFLMTHPSKVPKSGSLD